MILPVQWKLWVSFVVNGIIFILLPKYLHGFILSSHNLKRVISPFSSISSLSPPPTTTINEYTRQRRLLYCCSSGSRGSTLVESQQMQQQQQQKHQRQEDQQEQHQVQWSKTSHKEDKSSSSSSSSSPSASLIFPGGGIFFYWQAGVITYLREKVDDNKKEEYYYDLSNCKFCGVSAGALTATLTANGIDFYDATELALQLAAKANVWNRFGGLQGIWGPMIEEWLDILLPENCCCDHVVNDRLSLYVTSIPSFGKERISTFTSKKDLISCNMASVHLPWFLDGRLTSTLRGKQYIDGSFLFPAKDIVSQHKQHQNDENILVLDWEKDIEMESKGGLDIVETLSPDGIWDLLEKGKSYARRLEEMGQFECLVKGTRD